MTVSSLKIAIAHQQEALRAIYIEPEDVTISFTFKTLREWLQALRALCQDMLYWNEHIYDYPVARVKYRGTDIALNCLEKVVTDGPIWQVAINEAPQIASLSALEDIQDSAVYRTLLLRNTLHQDTSQYYDPYRPDVTL